MSTSFSFIVVVRVPVVLVRVPIVVGRVPIGLLRGPIVVVLVPIVVTRGPLVVIRGPIVVIFGGLIVFGAITIACEPAESVNVEAMRAARLREWLHKNPMVCSKPCVHRLHLVTETSGIFVAAPADDTFRKSTVTAYVFDFLPERRYPSGKENVFEKSQASGININPNMLNDFVLPRTLCIAAWVNAERTRLE